MFTSIQPEPPGDRKFKFNKLRHPNIPRLPWSCKSTNQQPQLQQPSLKGANVLCDICKGITLNALESLHGFTHSGKVVEQSAYVAKPCRLCLLIRKSLCDVYVTGVQHVDRDERMSTDQANETFSNFLCSENQAIILFASKNSGINLIPDPQFLEFIVEYPPGLALYTPSGSPSTGLTDYFVPCLTRSDATGLASHWISECFASHPECPKTIDSPLPKRLINLGCPDDEDDSVRLWLNPCWTDEKEGYRGPKGVYVALSYCWGTRSFITLTPENQASMVEGIDMACLPQIIRDAIEITRSLGICFLWVDALCILQGFSDQARNDWTEQSSQMASVYQQAVLTIAPGTSEDAHQGFQYAAGFEHELLALLPLTWSSSSCHSPLFVGPDCSVAEPYFSKLHTRGWTFQERLLSTRYVTFGLDGMVWECGHGRKYDNAYLEHYYQDDLSAEKLPSSPTFSNWYNLIEEYSQRQLTKPEDRLVALAGLRTYFCHLRAAHDRDIAGLWASNLPWGLLWEVQGKKDNGDPIGMAPSWSWASLPYPVSWLSTRMFEERHVCHSDCISILDTCTTSVTTELGMKIQGRISVRGFMRKITTGAESGQIEDELGNTLHRTFDDGNLEKASSSLGSHTDLPGLFYLEFHSNPGSIGLIVTPTGQSHNEFRRIGMCYSREGEATFLPNPPVVVSII